MSTRKAKRFCIDEVLVTFLIVAIGLLGLGALQINTMNNSFETYQRRWRRSPTTWRHDPHECCAAMAGEYFGQAPVDNLQRDDGIPAGLV